MVRDPMVDSEMVDTALLKVESFESWTSAPPQMLEDLSNLGFGFYQPRRVEVVAPTTLSYSA
jgi:hypothetical protein